MPTGISVLRLNYIRPGNDIRKKKGRKGPTGTERLYNRAKNKAAHYTQAVHNEYSLRSNESRCSNASCRQIAALKREKCRPTEKMRKTGNARPVEFRRISRWRYLFFSPTSSASSFIIAYANIRSPAPTLLTISFFFHESLRVTLLHGQREVV